MRDRAYRKGRGACREDADSLPYSALRESRVILSEFALLWKLRWNLWLRMAYHGGASVGAARLDLLDLHLTSRCNSSNIRGCHGMVTAHEI